VSDAQEIMTSTGVLKVKFGRFWPAWLWIGHQFSPTSLGVIGVVLAGAWGYISHLNSRVAAQETHITILETRVVPIIESGETIARLETAVAGIKGTLDATLSDHTNRLKRIEDNLDLDYNEHMKQEREQRAQRKRK
jgi:hypothetical protein